MSTDFRALRVAVVGYGSIGRRHVENLARLGVGEITVVRRRQHANPAFVPPADASVVHSQQAAIDRGLDLAIVCNPTSMHLDAAAPFARAGVPVLIEKPLAANAKDIDGARDWLETSNVGVAYCLRYHPAYQLAREALADGAVGRVLYANVWFESYLPDWHPWEDYRSSYAAQPALGGGVLPTLDHEIDFLHWVFGQRTSVSGWSARSGALDMPAADLAHLSFLFPNQVNATARFSLCRRDRSRGFEFIGDQGTLRLDWSSAALTLHASGGVETLWSDSAYDVNAMYLALLSDALTSIQSGALLPTPWQAGYAALCSADAARPLA
jgi:predicted dehydrogenase